MSELFDTTLDTCGCCEPEEARLPLYNRPGLPALSYRIGVYASFLRRMLGQVGTYTLQYGDFAGTRPLEDLTTRSLDDPAIALLDAGSVMADVLTFYQERIANEGFLRTASERRSILELARAIGYELNPGVAATAYLSFTVEDAQGAPGLADVPAGTRVQSIPPQGQLPQTFETAEALTAHKEWNVIRPRLSRPQAVKLGSKILYLSGSGSGLRVGDLLLLVIDTGDGGQTLARVHRTEVDSQAGYARVELTTSATMSFAVEPQPIDEGEVGEEKVEFSEAQIVDWILEKSWTDKDLNAFLSYNAWNRNDLLDTLADIRARNSLSTGEVHILHTSAGFFGNNAPRFASLPTGTGANYEPTWDTSGWEIWRDHPSNTYYDGGNSGLPDAYLEHPVSGLIPGSWVVLVTPGGTRKFARLASSIERSMTGFAISAKSTGLVLRRSDETDIPNTDEYKSSLFKVRDTIAYLQSEQLPLAELPITTGLDSGTDTLELDGLVLGLQIGQSVTLSGERTDAPGVAGREVLTIEEITHIGGFTTLRFEAGWQHSYQRDTVTLNANTVRATHGETVREILGSGSGALANQQFVLKKPPLTHTPAATPSGSAGTLQLRVNNLLWSQELSLYELGSTDESYIVRIDDDSKATVVFGDGVKGARLPTGENNITAVYRSGIGLVGQVDAGSLTLLPIRPMGVRSVANPLAAGGAADPEKMADARANAPLTVRTLDRIVSRQDYEDFASAFAGIGKAQAIDLWSGEHHLVHLTIAGADEQPVESSDFRDNFIDAIDKARDPAQMVRVDTFDLLLFNLSANVAVDDRYIVEDVFNVAYDALLDAFSFPNRCFGQAVTAAEVITVIQDVEGIIYVDLDLLYLTSDVEALNQILPAGTAHVAGGAIQQAQLLLVNTLGIGLQEVSA